MIRLSVHADPEAAARAAAERLAASIAAAQAARGGAHVSLAGGNDAPTGLRAARSRNCHTPRRSTGGSETNGAYPRTIRSPTTGSWPRACSPQASIPVERVHRVHGEEPPAIAAAAYEEELRRGPPATEAGIPILDAALLGLGEDGHTASLFPGDPALRVTDRLVVPVVAVKPPPNRITLTLPVFLAAREVLILATGAGKSDAVSRVLAGPDPSTPASLLAGADVTLVTDEAAASR